jgi:cytochrome c biogenesis protein CcmG/thiol:disulfide interchange protein DsbE
MFFSLRFLRLLALAAALILSGCRSGTQQEGTSASGSGIVLPGLDGTTTNLEDYRGKVVLVNFWATWGQPCRVEIPWLIEFDQKYGPQGLIILGVAMDDEGKKVVEPWVRDQRFEVHGTQQAMSYRIVLGNDSLADRFGGLIGLPTSIVYGRGGQKIRTIVGLVDHEDLVKTIESQL